MNQKKIIEQQNKLLEQQKDELNKLLKQEKQEEDIPLDIINEFKRNVDKMTEQNKLIEQENINFRTFALRRNPFDDIKKTNTFSNN